MKIDQTILEKQESNLQSKIEGQADHRQIKRDNFCISFIGHNRTGKSSIAKKTAIAWKKANPNGTVMAFDPQNNFLKLADKFIYITQSKTWGAEAVKLRNALLILDDYRLLLPKSQASQELAELLAFRAQWNIDIIYICHSPALVLNILTYYTTHYYIFYTLAQKNSFEKKIPHYELCETARNYINKYVRFHPEHKGNYPNFPHIVVDAMNEKLITQNIDGDFFKKMINKLRIKK